MKIDELENRLESIRLAPPSPTYLEDGLGRLRMKPGIAATLSGWRVAFTLVLLASLSMNLLQLRQDALPEETGILLASGGDRQQNYSNGQLAPEGVFGFLCLTRSTLVLDESYYLGDVQGFAEWVSLQIPEAYQLSLSFQALRDWEPVGSYADGVVTVELAAGQLLSFRSVGIGPYNSRPDGPIPVYGEVAALHKEASSAPSSSITASEPAGGGQQFAQLDRLRSPYLPVSDVVFGIDSQLNTREQTAFGKLINDNECG